MAVKPCHGPEVPGCAPFAQRNPCAPKFTLQADETDAWLACGP
jgi:hypothetical protein